MKQSGEMQGSGSSCQECPISIWETKHFKSHAGESEAWQFVCKVGGQAGQGILQNYVVLGGEPGLFIFLASALLESTETQACWIIHAS